MKINVKNLLYRLLVYVLGLFVLALGVAFSINSNLGVSPVNSLPYVLSNITGVELSLCVTGVFAVFVVLQIVILRRDFKWINVFQVAFSFVFGYFVKVGQLILGDFTIPTYFGQLLMMVISILLIGLGVAMYITAKLLPMPMEGLALTLASKSKKIGFSLMKSIVDTTAVCTAIALSFIFLHKLEGIREGTVISAICVGFAVKLFSKPVGKLFRIDRFPITNSQAEEPQTHSQSEEAEAQPEAFSDAE